MHDWIRPLAILAGGLVTCASVAEQPQAFPETSRRIPFALQQLHSSHPEVRRAFVRKLDHLDLEVKQILELLIEDEDVGVAAAAFSKYINGYLEVDRGLMARRAHLIHGFFNERHRKPPSRLLEHCLGTKPIVAPMQYNYVFPLACAGAPGDIDRWLHSEHYQVRDGAASVHIADPSARRRALEALVQDPHPGVARQALGGYGNSFVAVDRELVRENIAKIEEAVSEEDLADPAAMFWRLLPEPLAGPASPAPIKAIRLLGLVGEAAHAPLIEPFLESENPAVMNNAATALIRLGSAERVAPVLLEFLDRDAESTLHSHNSALKLLKELKHPGLAAVTRDLLNRAERWNVTQRQGIAQLRVFAASLLPDAL